MLTCQLQLLLLLLLLVQVSGGMTSPRALTRRSVARGRRLAS
jgi:hypothetical protein